MSAPSLPTPSTAAATGVPPAQKEADAVAEAKALAERKQAVDRRLEDVARKLKELDKRK